jgi:hypothetical protein
MPPRKRKKIEKNDKDCPEEISEEERLEDLGIFEDDEEDNESESWRNYG